MRTCTYFFMVLDIETSTYRTKFGEPVATWLSYGYNNLYSIEGKCIDRCYFRDWEELRNYYVKIANRFLGYKLLVFVHNLAYEMEYIIKNLSNTKKFLTNSTHHFISATLEDFPFLEFRCTAKLSAKRLDEIGESLGFEKLHSDYRTILPKDNVTSKEKEYCIRDCDIVAKYICDDMLKEYKNLTNIPYTKTGRVRKVYNDFYNKYVKANGLPTWDLYPNEDCYDALNDAFSGGITISNPLYTAVPVRNVHSYDISSSYPFAQLSEEFPYSIRKAETFNEESLKQKFWIAKIKFNNIISKFTWQWLSISKMNYFDELTSEFFNGKLMKSSCIIRTITNVDFEIIKMTYSYDSLEIIEFYEMVDYGTLPKPYIDTILFYANGKFEGKKKLKDVKEKYTENSNEYQEELINYTKIKNDFNSIYGMTVQKIMQDEYEIADDYSWKKKKIVYKKLDKHMKRNFLFGVYTTAYARYNLIKAIVNNCPYTFVYADTDSIKFFGENIFIDTNKSLPDIYKENVSVSSLGRFEYEGKYDYFLTYGAKKYGYMENDILHLTVAGLPKSGENCKYKIYYNGKVVGDFYRSISNFRLGTIFHNCKLGKKYIYSNFYYELDENYNVANKKKLDEEAENFLKNNGIKSNGGVALFECSYSLSMTKLDIAIVKEHHAILNTYERFLYGKIGIKIFDYVTKDFMIEEDNYAN